MHHRPIALAGLAEFADAVAQHCFEVRAEPERIGHQVDFPQPVLGAADRPLQAGLSRVQGRFGALQIADVDDGARDPHHLAGLVVRHRGFLADPALTAIVEHHPVLAEIGRIAGGGLERLAAAALDVIRMHPRQQEVEIVEPGRGRDTQEVMEVVGADAAVAVEIEVEGRDAGGALGDVQRLGGVAQLLFQLLARSDVADGADHTGRAVFGIVHDLTAAGQPADLAVRHQRTVFGLVLGARVDGGAQLHRDGFEVFRVDGRKPLLARQRLAAPQADEIEEQGGAADVTGHEIKVKDAETSGSRGKLEKIGGFAHATTSTVKPSRLRLSAGSGPS